MQNLKSPYSTDRHFNLIINGKLEEADQYRMSFVPDKLYKYFWLENEIGRLEDEYKKVNKRNERRFSTLRESYLWASQVNQLNDPYEFQCMYLDRKKLKSAGYPERKIKLLENIMNEPMKRLGVVCLSARSPEDSMPMWAYYANNGKGFCVEYNVTNAKQIHKVSYEPRRVPIASIFIGSLKEAILSDDHAGQNGGHPAIDTTLFVQQFFMKHESWVYEQEYRFLCAIPKGAIGCKVDTKSAGLEVSRIIAGINCSQEHYAQLNKISNQLGCGDAYRIELGVDSFAGVVR